METNAYVIYDKAAKVYNKPFYLVNDAVAIRALQELIDDPRTDIARHPDDFSLFAIGTYEDATATFVPLGDLRRVARAHELTPRNPPIALAEVSSDE